MAVVLLVDDEPRSLESMEMALEDMFTTRRARSAAEALAIVAAEPVDLVLSDQRMPGMSGVELLTQLRTTHPGIGRMIVTGYTDPQDMIAAINTAGIQRFIQKPWHPEELQRAVQDGLAAIEAADAPQLAGHAGADNTGQVDAGHGDPAPRDAFAAVLRTPGGEMDRIIAAARVLARYDVPCLLIGAQGSGRRTLAQAIAQASGRGPARAVSALAGAEAVQAALAPQAGGTLVLRDLEAAPLAVQAALAGALAAGGPGLPRLIATTTDAAALLPELALRLSVEPLRLPPLAERRQDIPALAEALLARAARTHGLPAPQLSPAALDQLRAAPWPGNLRALENMMTRLLLFTDGPVIDAIPEVDAQADAPADAAEIAQVPTAAPIPRDGTLRERVAEVEMAMIEASLARHHGNKSRASEELGLSRVGLRAKMDRYGMKED